MSKFLAIDTETTGLDLRGSHRPFGVSACDHLGRTWWWETTVDPLTRMPRWNARTLRGIKSTLARFPRLVMHNASFDALALQTVGIDLSDRWADIEDTRLASHVFDSTDDRGLKDLAEKYLDVLADDEDELKSAVKSCRRQLKHDPAVVLGKSVGNDYWLPGWAGRTYPSRFPPEYRDLAGTYGTRDAVRTALLWMFFSAQLQRRGDYEHYQREQRLVPIVAGMENAGIRVIRTRLQLEMRYYCQKADEAEQSVFQESGTADFNIRSPLNLTELLYDRLGLEVIKTTPSGMPSTDKQTLEELADAHPDVPALQSTLEYRYWSTGYKYLREYERLQQSGILHTNFNQVGTGTTRFSSSCPNLQNVGLPDDTRGETTNLRRVFGPRLRHIWYAIDYSNLELRIFAWMSGDRQLKEAFLRGESIHLTIAEELHGPRVDWPGLADPTEYKDHPFYKRTKNGDFALIYGAAPAKANETYKVPDAYNRIRHAFPGIDRFMEATVNRAQKDGYVTTAFGYPLAVPRQRPYTATNYVIQGTAGDILKNAMLDCDAYLAGTAGGIVLTVHDELIFELPRSAEHKTIAMDLAQIMADQGSPVGIPTAVGVQEIRRSWDSARTVGHALARMESTCEQRI